MNYEQSKISQLNCCRLGFLVIFIGLAMFEYSTFAVAQETSIVMKEIQGPRTAIKANQFKYGDIVHESENLKVTAFGRHPLADDEGRCPIGTVPYLSTEWGEVVTKKKFIASGYGAPPVRNLSPPQKRLLALRAAKLDAMRTLAERISGVHIWGGATVSDLVLESDKIYVRLDAFLQGAHVLSVQRMTDGTYEAVMQVNLNKTALTRLNINRCLPKERV